MVARVEQTESDQARAAASAVRIPNTCNRPDPYRRTTPARQAFIAWWVPTPKPSAKPPRALNVERDAHAIVKGLKTRCARNAVDAHLVDTLRRALIACDDHDGHDDPSEPWMLG